MCKVVKLSVDSSKRFVVKGNVVSINKKNFKSDEDLLEIIKSLSKD